MMIMAIGMQQSERDHGQKMDIMLSFEVIRLIQLGFFGKVWLVSIS